MLYWNSSLQSQNPTLFRRRSLVLCENQHFPLHAIKVPERSYSDIVRKSHSYSKSQSQIEVKSLILTDNRHDMDGCNGYLPNLVRGFHLCNKMFQTHQSQELQQTFNHSKSCEAGMFVRDIRGSDFGVSDQKTNYIKATIRNERKRAGNDPQICSIKEFKRVFLQRERFQLEDNKSLREVCSQKSTTIEQMLMGVQEQRHNTTLREISELLQDLGLKYDPQQGLSCEDYAELLRMSYR